MIEPISDARHSSSVRRSRTQAVIASIGVAALFVIGWGAYHAYLSHEREEEWKRQVEACGAQVYRMGYATSPMARIPVFAPIVHTLEPGRLYPKLGSRPSCAAPSPRPTETRPNLGSQGQCE